MNDVIKPVKPRPYHGESGSVWYLGFEGPFATRKAAAARGEVMLRTWDADDPTEVGECSVAEWYAGNDDEADCTPIMRLKRAGQRAKIPMHFGGMMIVERASP